MLILTSIFLFHSGVTVLFRISLFIVMVAISFKSRKYIRNELGMFILNKTLSGIFYSLSIVAFLTLSDVSLLDFESLEIDLN